MKLTIRYNNKTGKITQLYWGSNKPGWATESVENTTVTTTQKSREERKQTIQNAVNSVKKGSDYNPETKRVAWDLYYDSETDDLYAEAEIQPLSS